MQNLTPLTLDDKDFNRFRALILAESGLDYPDNKRADLEIGLTKAFTTSSLPTSAKANLDGYYNLLSNQSSRQGQAELKHLINSLTIGETYFFRDEAQFDALFEHVLPSIIQRKLRGAARLGSQSQPQLRLWSAGCASGEEAYSLAMMVQALIPDISRWHIMILATDINDDLIEQAKVANYSEWSFREGRAKALRPTYFTAKTSRNSYRLNPSVATMVTFKRLNLVEDSYPSPQNNTLSMDLILCRNVTIYFQKETTQKIINRFHEALIPAGWLVVGHSELSLTTYQSFERRNFTNTVMYQKPTLSQAKLARKHKRITDPLAEIAATADNELPQPALPLTPSQWQGEQATPPLGRSSFASTGERDSANLTAEQATVNTPNTQPDAYQLAKELFKQGKIDEALEKLQYKIKQRPSAIAYSLMGRIYADSGHLKQAETNCLRALQLNPLRTEAYITLSLIYQAEGRLDLAVANLKKATYLDHTTPLPYFNLAMLYQQMGQLQQAHRNFRVVMRILEKWDAEDIIQDMDGQTVHDILDICQRMLNKPAS